jgi:hypothetical protein
MIKPFVLVETSPAPRRSTIFMQAHMIEQSVSGGLGRLGEMIDTSELGRGAAECPCGVVRQVVLATRGAPATMLIVLGLFLCSEART